MTSRGAIIQRTFAFLQEREAETAQSPQDAPPADPAPETPAAGPAAAAGTEQGHKEP
jgi:hypothetical protein